MAAELEGAVAVAEFLVGRLRVRVFETGEALAGQAARDAVPLLQEAIRAHGRARVIFAAANSQLDLVAELTSLPGIDWGAVEAFHIDEWVGLPASHPASFRGWIQQRIVDRVHPRRVHYLAGDAPDLKAECRRYAALLAEAPIDLSFLGIGENGHIGFNDPHEANFTDPLMVRQVSLDERCRQQQADEGHWPDLSSVPRFGLTLTCPALLATRHIICCVPDTRKSEAVRSSLEQPVSVVCPGSLLRTHSSASLYLDRQSASLLSRQLPC